MERIPFKDAFADLKTFIRPLVPANKDVEMALVHLIRRRKNYRRTGTLETTPPSERRSEREKESVNDANNESRKAGSKPGGHRRRRSGDKRRSAGVPRT